MIATFILAAAVLQSAPDKPPKFGAYVETLLFEGALEFVTYNKDGSVVVPDSADELARTRCVVIAADGTRYSTGVGDDRIRVDVTAGAEPTWTGGRGREPGKLCKPGGLAFNSRGDGCLIVADTLNHRVALFGSTIDVLGRLGTGDGELNHPHDVAIDATGAIFVADSGNDRIVKFAADGKFVKSFGGRGSYPGLFRHPTGIDVHGERVYVADRDNHRIQVFDLAGEFIYEWGVSALLPREGQGKLHDPSDVAVSPKGDRVAVIEPMENRIQVFGIAREDTLMTSPDGDTGVHFGGFPSVRRDVLAVANPTGPSVSIFDLTLGTPVEITKFGRPGNGHGRMRRPVSVLLDEKAERVYVADPYAYTISAYRIDRKPDEVLRFDPFLARFETSIDLTSTDARVGDWPIEPAGMSLGRAGELLVADRANDWIAVVDADLRRARLVRGRTTVGSVTSRITSPNGIQYAAAIDRIVVASQSQNAPSPTFDSDYAYVSNDGYGAALSSHLVAWRSDPLMKRLIRGEMAEGAHLLPDRFAFVGGPGVGRLQFWWPEGLCIDELDRVFVVDAGNHRFQILDSNAQYIDMFGARFYTEAARNPPPPTRDLRAWDGARSVRTRDASWRVVWKPKPPAIERGVVFAVDAWVFKPGFPTEPERDIDLRLDAYMPEHLHGMNRIPTVSKREDGGFTIEGVVLHMSGFWELDFDVTSRGVTERATTRIDLE